MSSNFMQTAKDLFKVFINPEQIVDANDKFITFSDLDEKEDLFDANSVVDSIIYENSGIETADPTFKDISVYQNLIYTNLSADKVRRLNFFRQMAKFPEVGDAIDEICDSCIIYDEKDDFLNITFREGDDLSSARKTKIQHLFDEFISMFEIETKGWELFYSLIRDGELAWENVLDENNSDLGIVKINRIPPECYEYLIDRKYDIVGLLLNAKLLRGEEANIDAKNS